MLPHHLVTFGLPPSPPPPPPAPLPPALHSLPGPPRRAAYAVFLGREISFPP